MAEKKTGRPVRKSKKQVAMQRKLLVFGVVAAIFLIIFGAGALWGHGLGSSAKPEKIAEAVKGLGQLASVDYTYTSVQTYKDQDSFYGWDEAGNIKNFTVSYNGEMRLYSDTSNLTKDKVAIDKKKVTITIPSVTIGSHEIDQNSISVFDTDDKAFRSIGSDLEDFSGFCSDRKDVDVQGASDRGVLTDAQTKVTDLIKAVVGKMGKFDEINVVFA